MDIDELKKAQDDLKMLEALGLPATEAQKRALFELEKNYVTTNILPQIIGNLNPMVCNLKNSFQVKINYSEKGGLCIESVHNFDDALKGETLEDKANAGRFLGIDPKSGKRVYVKVTNYGLLAQIGDNSLSEKPSYLRLKKDTNIEDVSLEDVLTLSQYPRRLGYYEGMEIVIRIGPYGPYIKHNEVFYNLPRGEDPGLIDHEKAIAIIEKKRQSGVGDIIAKFDNDPNMVVINGRFGPYIKYHKENYKIPSKYTPSLLSYNDCLSIISDPTNKAQKWVPKRK